MCSKSFKLNKKYFYILVASGCVSMSEHECVCIVYKDRYEQIGKNKWTFWSFSFIFTFVQYRFALPCLQTFKNSYSLPYISYWLGINFSTYCQIIILYVQCSLIWRLMLYKFEQHHNAKEAAKNICWVKGHVAVDHSTVTEWFKKFCSSCEKLNNQEMSSHPNAVDSGTVLQAI